MNGFLTITNRALAFHDSEATSQPGMKAYDWTMGGAGIKSLSVADPKTYGGTIAASATETVFDGTRTTSLDGTTAFASTLSTLDAGSRYRFTWTGGTNPTLRTDRGLTLATQSATFAVNTDSTVNLTIGGGTFGTTVAGDIIFIPGVTTGDAASVFSELNVGFWSVLAVISTTNLQLARLPGESFSATGETVTVASNAQLQAFSAAGVQVGDNVRISAGFSTATRRTYSVDRVTSTWFEVLSTAPIAAETGKLPGAAGMVFYTDAKRFFHLEVDQFCVVRFNSDTSDNNELEPIQAGDKKQPGWEEKFGPTFKLVIVNKATVPLNYVAFSAR